MRSCLAVALAVATAIASTTANTGASYAQARSSPSTGASKCTGLSGSLPADQCAAWADFFDATGGPNWTVRTRHFPTGLAPCSRTDPCACIAWDGGDIGVICATAGLMTTVQSVSLTNCNLQGQLPDSIGAWADLVAFSVSSNNLTGSVPPTTSKWTKLTLASAGSFDVSKNALSGGPLPALPFAQMPQAPAWARCRLINDHYGGTNSFECPWPKGATEACVKWVQNGTLTGWAPITDLDCVSQNEESAATATTPVVLHVDPSALPGQAPLTFNSLPAARDHIRAMKTVATNTESFEEGQSKGGAVLDRAAVAVVVLVHPGTYPPFALTAADSGTALAPITYTSVRGVAEPAIISGGISIPASAFTPIPNSKLVRADLFAHNVTAADLGAMVNGGSIGDCQHTKTDFVFGGERMSLGRWPNIGSSGSAGDWSFANVDTVVGGSAAVGVNTKTQPTAARLLDWANELNPWIHGYWTFDWTGMCRHGGGQGNGCVSVCLICLCDYCVCKHLNTPSLSKKRLTYL